MWCRREDVLHVGKAERELGRVDVVKEILYAGRRHSRELDVGLGALTHRVREHGVEVVGAGGKNHAMGLKNVGDYVTEICFFLSVFAQQTDSLHFWWILCDIAWEKETASENMISLKS